MDKRADRLRQLFDACYEPLLAYAFRRAGPADADDLVAEVFTTAWRRLDDIPEGRELPWLYGVARRTLANQRRSTDRRARLVHRLRQNRAERSVADDDHGQVHAALARLRPADREILRLAAWEQLSVAEIGVVLDCTENAAALRMSRARRRLRAALTDMASSRTQEEWKVTDA